MPDPIRPAQGADGDWIPRRLVAVALSPAIDKIAAVDRLLPGTIHRPRVLAAVAGGKAANVARAANKLGLPGTLVAVLGGHAGAWYREALEARGIGLHAVDVPGETRTCLSVLDEADGALTEFYEAGGTLGPSVWTRIETALRDALGADGGDALVVLAGSLPPGVPIDAYARLGRLAAATGARVAVDVGGAPLEAALEASPWLVKVNAAEAGVSDSVDGRIECLAAGRRLLAAGAGNVIVTRGTAGAVLVGPDGAWEGTAVPADARGRYPVGSGDAFLAGLAAGVARGLSLPAALPLAAACGAANARIPGQGELERSVVGELVGRLAVLRVAT